MTHNFWNIINVERIKKIVFSEAPHLRWLFKDFIPQGKVVVVLGQGGAG